METIAPYLIYLQSFFLLNFNVLNILSLSSVLMSGLLYLLFYMYKAPKEDLILQDSISTTIENPSDLNIKQTQRKLDITEILSLFKQDDFINKCMLIVQSQLQNEQFNVPTLAKEMYMCRVSLYRKIKKRTGRTAITFIKVVRLIEAHKLLKETSFSISDIAYRVGFKAPSHFSTSYKKEYGCTPKQMRKKLRAA